jgi:predicted P-loop ATPase
VRFRLYPEKEMLREAVTNLCTENNNNPVLDYFAAVPAWDQTSRLNTMLHTYLGAADTPLNAAYGRKFMCAIVRRAKSPGCKWDHELVLQGRQGLRKSWFCEDLAVARDLFTDTGEVGSSIKEQMEAMMGKQIIEFPEKVGNSEKVREKAKAMQTRKIDSARLAYDRYTTDAPRSSVNIATVNPGGYLNDPTGERRYWHVNVTAYDRDAFLRDKEQLYAEALVREPDEGLWLDTDDLLRAHDAVTATVKVPNAYIEMLEELRGTWWENTHFEKAVDEVHVRRYGEIRVSTDAVRARLGLANLDVLRLKTIGTQITEAMMALGWSKGSTARRCSHAKNAKTRHYFYRRLPNWYGPILEDFGAVDEISEEAQQEINDTAREQVEMPLPRARAKDDVPF